MCARLAMAAFLIAAVLPSTAVAVSASMTGGGVFTGTATLPSFPCACIGGTFSGSASLTVSGMATSSLSGVPVPYAAAWTGATNNASAAFNYTESCIDGQPGTTPPPTGSASGTFVIAGGVLSLAGGPLMSATLSGSLDWLRVGTGARITLFSLTITAPSSGGPTVAMNLTDMLEGQSAAGFLWTNGPGTCATSQSNQTALIDGLAVQPV